MSRSNHLPKLTWRRRLKLAFLIAVPLYLVMWAITARFGTDNIEGRYLSAMTSDVRQEHCGGQGLPATARIKYPGYDYEDPDSTLRLLDDNRPPWFYVTEAYSPLPFIVTVEHGGLIAEMYGGGGQTYSFWFFGFSYDFHYDMYWNS